MEAIGFLELNSIAKGIEAADFILKTAEVRMLSAKAGCPGKYYILFTGDVAAVKASLEAGKRTGGGHVVDECVIPRVHPQVIKAINMTAIPERYQAIGVMEFYSVTASVYAADAAVKAADVDLVDVRLGTGIGGTGAGRQECNVRLPCADECCAFGYSETGGRDQHLF